MDKLLAGTSGVGAILANTAMVHPVISTIAAIISIACGVALFVKYGFEIRKTLSENDKLIAEKNKVNLEAKEHECPFKDSDVKPCHIEDVINYYKTLQNGKR